MSVAVDQLLGEVREELALPPPARCKAIRENAGLTLIRVGTALGVSPGAVHMWETGLRVPRGRRRAEYAELLRELEKLTSSLREATAQ